MAVVYKHIRLDTNNIFYVGIGKKLNRAFDKSGRSGWWKKVVNKAGYRVEIIEDNLSYEECKEKEKYWIKYYGRINTNTGCLINMTDGGDGTVGYIPTKEAVERSRQANIGRKHIFTDEHKRKIGLANKGKVISESTRSLLRERNIGKHYGRRWIVSDKTRENMRKAKLGTIQPIEVINKRIAYVIKPINQLDKEGNFIKHWNSITEAQNLFKKGSCSINYCLKGKTKTAYGYKWEYCKTKKQLII